MCQSADQLAGSPLWSTNDHQITMKFGSDIHVHLRVKTDDFGDNLTFNLSNTLFYNQISAKVMAFPSACFVPIDMLTLYLSMTAFSTR